CRNVAQTHGQSFMAQPSRRGVFELEINVFDQQVNGDERFAGFPLAQDRGVITDSEDQVGRLAFPRLIANVFYEVELTLHLSGRRNFQSAVHLDCAAEALPCTTPRPTRSDLITLSATRLMSAFLTARIKSGCDSTSEALRPKMTARAYSNVLAV